MDSLQDLSFVHWISKISHFWPISRTLRRSNSLIQASSEEMQFTRVALFSGNPFFWMDPLGEYEHSLSVRKLLNWYIQMPNVHLGLNPNGIGLIVRSIFDKRQKTASVSEDRVLDNVGAYKDEELSWETDDARFGPFVDQLFQYINQEDTFDGYVWVDPREIEWLSVATFDSLMDYQENNRSTSQYQILLNRHRCMFFAPFDIDTFSKHLQRLSGVDGTKYQTLFSNIIEAYDQLGLFSPITIYWSWELLNFASVEGRLLYKPVLALWSDWPYSTRWAPPRPVNYETAAPFSSTKAASFLEEVLWKGIETIFEEVSLDCGLPWRKPITSIADRKIYAPLYYFAEPTTPPVNSDDYVGKRKLDINPFVKTCLGSEDPLSGQLAWGMLEGNLVALRHEWGDLDFWPLYMLLPINSESIMSWEIYKEIDEILAEVVRWLTSQECSIAVQAADIDKKGSSISSRIALWPSTLNAWNNAVEEAITLLPLLGRSDRKRMSDALEGLHIPLRRLQALIEKTVAEEDEVQRMFSDSVDSTDDALRHMTLSSLQFPGVRNLHDALLDSYPYHHLKQPNLDLHSQMELLLSRSERINTSLNTILTEVARDAREHLERWARRVGILFALLALLIGLPTFIPQASLRPDTYPRWLERYLPLTQVEAGARLLSIAVGLSAILMLIFYAVAWIRQYLPGHPDEVQHFSALVSKAEDATRNTPDRNKLERLDEKAIRVLAAIWDQPEQKSDKRKVFHWIQRPFRSVQATDWLQNVRFTRDIINLFVLLPETIKTIKLPRTLCILRYKMVTSEEPLISDEYFVDSLREIGFKADDISRIEAWLTEEKNKVRLEQLNVRTFATILEKRGVTAALKQGMVANWDGPLDEEQAHFNLGDSLVKQKKYEEAIIAYQEAIKCNPRVSDYYDSLGTAYYGYGKYEDAIISYRKAIHLESDNPYFHNNLAFVYLVQGKLGEAKQEFQNRIKLNPENALAANVSLGIILIYEGQLETGSVYLHRAIEIYTERASKQKIMSSPEYRASYDLARVGLGEEHAASEYQETIQSMEIPLSSLKEDLSKVELLAASSKPPPGIEQVVATLKERCIL
jgi:tetratricopeptide (TPR) repeat protein